MKFNPDLIQQYREKQNYTQLELVFLLRGEGVEIVPDTLSRWENGITNPDANMLPALAKLLKVRVEDFYDDGK